MENTRETDTHFSSVPTALEAVLAVERALLVLGDGEERVLCDTAGARERGEGAPLSTVAVTTICLHEMARETGRPRSSGRLFDAGQTRRGLRTVVRNPVPASEETDTAESLPGGAGRRGRDVEMHDL